MPGYLIFEKRFLTQYKVDGFMQHPNKIGFLDFLREVKNYASDLPKLGQYCVFGIDDLLYMIEPANRTAVAIGIHRQLGAVAQKLESKVLDVQVICKGKLVRGDSLWLQYRNEKLPIDIIFGDLRKQEDRHRNEFYMASFNLTSG
jgi:hypothetical protein